MSGHQGLHVLHKLRVIGPIVELPAALELFERPIRVDQSRRRALTNANPHQGIQLGVTLDVRNRQRLSRLRARGFGNVDWPEEAYDRLWRHDDP